MSDFTPYDRCRLVLIVPSHVAEKMTLDDAHLLSKAGDISSVIFSPGPLEDEAFQEAVAPLVEPFQQAGTAVIVETATRVAGRCGADGLQLGQDVNDLSAAIEKYTPNLMVGAGNVKTRHNALVIGELQPDYIMFGKPGGDIRPEPHPKNLDLGQWWSALVEIPCIVLGGTDITSALAVAETGAEFVALSHAIFSTPDAIISPKEEGKEAPAVDFEQAAAKIAAVNALLDEHAPKFEEPDE